MQLAAPASVLALAFDFVALREHLGARAARFDVDHIGECSSTNTLLLRRSAGLASGSVLVCDTQTAGRGRRGRTWSSPPGASLCFSLFWRFDARCVLDGISLVVGVAVVRALSRLGLAQAGLKWPNDIWLDGRKLGGVLVESAAGGVRPELVIGIGLNLRRHAELETLPEGCAAFSDVCEPPAREVVLAVLLDEMGSALDQFVAAGFAAFREAWMERHALQARAVRVIDEQRSLCGICVSVDTDGALLLSTEAGVRRVTVGEASLREDHVPAA